MNSDERTPVDVDPLTIHSNKNNSSDEDDEPLFDDSPPSKEKQDFEEKSEEDLFVTVTEPDKQVTSMETYIQYKVTTNTSRAAFNSSQYVVKRRYHDFVWLREKLEEEYPTFIIAPLPSKFVVKGMLDRFSLEFTRKRCSALNVFMQRLVNHPVVSCSDHLKTFLTSENFSAAGKQGILARVSGSFMRSSVSTPEYHSIVESVTEFGDKIAVVDRISERLLAEKIELVNEVKEFAPTFSDWGEVEKEPIENLMTLVKDCLELCADSADDNATTLEQEVLPVLKEYSLYAEAIKQVMKKRDEFQYHFEKTDNEYKAKKQEKENLFKPDQGYSIGSLVGKKPEQREEKLAQQIKDLSSRREKFNDDLTKANTDFQVDYERWKEQKKKDTASMLALLGDSQITYHSECIKAWEHILTSMKNSSSEEN